MTRGNLVVHEAAARGEAQSRAIPISESSSTATQGCQFGFTSEGTTPVWIQERIARTVSFSTPTKPWWL